MDANDKDFFVVGAVENANVTSFGKAANRTPEEVVAEFQVAWLFEAENLAALRIHPRHDVFDDAILAGGVHCLQNQEQSVAVMSVQKPLQSIELFDVMGQDALVVFF